MSTKSKIQETDTHFIYGALTTDQMEYIFKEVLNDRGGHGDFLKSFAQAFIRADFQNRAILYPSAMELILKYKLGDYLSAEET